MDSEGYILDMDKASARIVTDNEVILTYDVSRLPWKIRAALQGATDPVVSVKAHDADGLPHVLDGKDPLKTYEGHDGEVSVYKLADLLGAKTVQVTENNLMNVVYNLNDWNGA